MFRLVFNVKFLALYKKVFRDILDNVEMTGVGQYGCLSAILVAFGWFWLALADCK